MENAYIGTKTDKNTQKKRTKMEKDIENKCASTQTDKTAEKKINNTED